MEQEKQEVAKVLEKVEARVAQEAPVAQEAQPEREAVVEEATRQRRAFKPFYIGDAVEIFSARNKQWEFDGEVTAITNESFMDGIERVPAGSTKVVYGSGRRYKWVPSQKLADLVRASARPKSPDPMVGELCLEVYSWFIAGWEKRYFELNKGFLQWWQTAEDAKRGVAPATSVYLLGLQQEQRGLSIKFRTDNTQRAIYTIMADSKEELQAWTEALWLHAEFCEEEYEFYKKQDGTFEEANTEQARYKASIHAKDQHLRRPSLASVPGQSGSFFGSTSLML